MSDRWTPDFAVTVRRAGGKGYDREHRRESNRAATLDVVASFGDILDYELQDAFHGGYLAELAGAAGEVTFTIASPLAPVTWTVTLRAEAIDTIAALTTAPAADAPR